MVPCNDILGVMKNTCINDEFTTNPAMIPSGNKVQAGYGKIDCLAGLKEILGTTGIETIKADTDLFCDGAEQNDDITLLSFRVTQAH